MNRGFTRHLVVLTIAGAILMLAACTSTSTDQTPEPTATHAKTSVTPTQSPAPPPPSATPSEGNIELDPATAPLETPAAATPSVPEAAEPVTDPEELAQYNGEYDASAFDEDGDGAYSPSELRASIESLYPLYTWPADYWISESAITETVPAEIEGHPIDFSFGSQYTLVEIPYSCAWSKQYIDDLGAGDTAGADLALAMLMTWVDSTPILADYDRDRWQGWIEEARLGDPSAIQMMATGGSCTSVEWETGP